jgi:hypothetical protein
MKTTRHKNSRKAAKAQREVNKTANSKGHEDLGSFDLSLRLVGRGSRKTADLTSEYR